MPAKDEQAAARRRQLRRERDELCIRLFWSRSNVGLEDALKVYITSWRRLHACRAIADAASPTALTEFSSRPYYADPVAAWTALEVVLRAWATEQVQR